MNFLGCVLMLAITFPVSYYLARGCLHGLLRTLLSYRGAPTDQGGTILHPDLAASLPTVSAEGRTWTFRVKSGLHYAPPLNQVEITARDIIRALERAANLKASAGGYVHHVQGDNHGAA